MEAKIGLMRMRLESDWSLKMIFGLFYEDDSFSQIESCEDEI